MNSPRCAGLPVIALAALLTIGAARGSDQLRFSPSRKVAFQSVSLLVIGGYLGAMFLVAQWLSFAGGDFAKLMQFGFSDHRHGRRRLAAALAPPARLDAGDAGQAPVPTPL